MTPSARDAMTLALAPQDAGTGAGPSSAGDVIRPAGGPRPGRARPWARLVLVAEERLVAETVRVALQSRGFEPVVLGWPTSRDPVVDPGRRPDIEGSRVGMIFGDVATRRRRAEARAVVEALPLRWLLVVNDPGDAAWGSMTMAGAAGVLPTSVSLDELTLALRLMLGGQDLLSPARRRAMAEAWAESERLRAQDAALIGRLTGREHEVLVSLYEGVGVAAIAEQTGVSEQTVRSQVKAVLRKLEVNSQLAAVALYQRVLGRD